MNMFVRKSAGRLESGWCIFISSSLISLCFPWPECVFTPLQLQKASEQRCQTVCVSEWRKGFLRQLIVGHDRSNDASQVRFVITAHNWHIWCVLMWHCTVVKFRLLFWRGEGKKSRKSTWKHKILYCGNLCTHTEDSRLHFFKKSFFNIWQKLQWEK